MPLLYLMYSKAWLGRPLQGADRCRRYWSPRTTPRASVGRRPLRRPKSRGRGPSVWRNRWCHGTVDGMSPAPHHHHLEAHWPSLGRCSDPPISLCGGCWYFLRHKVVEQLAGAIAKQHLVPKVGLSVSCCWPGRAHPQPQYCHRAMHTYSWPAWSGGDVLPAAPELRCVAAAEPLAKPMKN